MLRAVYIPDSNCINISIPDKYVGMELEILVSPLNEGMATKTEKTTPDIDMSLKKWANMNKKKQYLEPNDDLRRAITMDELLVGVLEDIHEFYANK